MGEHLRIDLIQEKAGNSEGKGRVVYRGCSEFRMQHVKSGNYKNI